MDEIERIKKDMELFTKNITEIHWKIKDSPQKILI